MAQSAGGIQFLSVSELTSVIKGSLESNPLLNDVWIRGELSNVTAHSSGHIYCSLKDEGAILQAAFFKHANRNLKFKPEEGMSVLVCGRVTVYEKRGNYQLIISDMILDGIGAIQMRIDQLRRQLQQEGIFDSSRKKELPVLPKRLGVVTSPTGAAFRDILKVALRRFPELEIVLAPAKVQGDDAAATIVRGIEELNDPRWGIDVIIAGRGGGSFEDLLPFNEEDVVRAFAASRLPIISAVGHQIDHPLSDDAADWAAPTPSAAAERAVPVKADLESRLHDLETSQDRALRSKLELFQTRLDHAAESRVMREPLEMIAMRGLSLDDCRNRMYYSIREQMSWLNQRLSQLPDMQRIVHSQLRERKLAFSGTVRALDQLSPLKTLERGYAAALDSDGNIIRSIHEVTPEAKITVAVSDGSITCTVNGISKEVFFGKKEGKTGPEEV